MLQVSKRKNHSKLIIAILSMCIAFGLFIAPNPQRKSVHAAIGTPEISLDGTVLTVIKHFANETLKFYKVPAAGGTPINFKTVYSAGTPATLDLSLYNDDFEYGVDYKVYVQARQADASYKTSNEVIYTNNTPVGYFPEDPVKEGHTFIGWYYDAAFTQPYQGEMITEDITLYAKFEIIQYTITYISNSAVVSTDTLNWNSVIENTQLSKVGYTFVGWYTDEALTQAYNFSNTLKSNLTLYAKWSVNKVTVTFIVDGAVYNTLEVAYGTILTNDINAANYVEAMGELFTDAGKKTDLIPRQ